MIHVACGIMYNEKNKILMGKRKKDDIDYPNIWEFPGGKLESNETLEECLHREWKEELNLKIKIYSLFTFAESKNMTLHYFIGKIIDMENIKVNVHQYIDFFYPSDMHNLSLFDGDDKIIDLLLDTSTIDKKIDKVL